MNLTIDVVIGNSYLILLVFDLVNQLIRVFNDSFLSLDITRKFKRHLFVVLVHFCILI